MAMTELGARRVLLPRNAFAYFAPLGNDDWGHPEIVDELPSKGGLVIKLSKPDHEHLTFGYRIRRNDPSKESVLKMQSEFQQWRKQR